MSEKNMSCTQLSKHVSVYNNGMNMVFIKKNNKTMAMHCPLFTLAQANEDFGITLDSVVCLNYRASLNGGITSLPEATRIYAPLVQKDYFLSPLGIYSDIDNNVFDSNMGAYMICKNTGLDTSDMSFPDVQSRFEGMEVKDIREALSNVRDIAGKISERMAKELEPPKREAR